jgi:hypothetical protein
VESKILAFLTSSWVRLVEGSQEAAAMNTVFKLRRLRISEKAQAR